MSSAKWIQASFNDADDLSAGFSAAAKTGVLLIKVGISDELIYFGIRNFVCEVSEGQNVI